MNAKSGDDKIAGVLMGLCLGSALGAPLENARAGAVKSAFGSVLSYVDVEAMVGNKLHRWRTPGLYGVEAQLALALLDAAFESRGGFDAGRAGRLFVAMSRGDAALPLGALRGAGRDLGDAILALKQGLDPALAGHTNASSAPAARIAPLAVWHSSNPHALPDIIIQASLLTHRNPMSVSAAAAAARMVLDLVNKTSLPRNECAALFSNAAAYARDIEDRLAANYPDSLEGTDAGRTLHAFSSTLEKLCERLDWDEPAVHDWLVQNARDLYPGQLARAAVDFAPCCAPYALFVFARHAAEPARALAAAVAQGGAAGAMGAMAGALCGALHGESGLPENLLSGLANRRQLRTRALALAARKAPGAQAADLYEMEESLTRKELEEREARMRKNRRFNAAQEKKALKKAAAPDPAAERIPGKQPLDRKKLKKLKEKQRDWSRYYPPPD